MGQSIDTAFLLTAGVGSRLRPHTDVCPKASLPFLTLPLCYYSFFLCKKAGFQDYIFNIHYLPERVRKTISGLEKHINKLNISDETQKILGSGGAFHGARSFIEPLEAFLVANGDEFMIPPQEDILSLLREEFDKTQPLACLLVTDHPELLKTLKPVWVNSRGEVVGFGMEKPNEDCKPFHFTGYKVYDSQILDSIPEGESNIFYDILIQRIAQGDRVTTLHIPELPWFETGNFSSYLEATRQGLKKIESNNAPYLHEVFRFYGKNLEDWHVLREKDSYLFKRKDQDIPEDLQWKGLVSIDEGVSIGSSVSLENIIATAGSTIETESNHSNGFIWPKEDHAKN